MRVASNKNNSAPTIIQPFAGTSQVLAIACPANEILLHGTRGGGKSEMQLLRFAKNVGVGYGEYWKGALFDCEYKALRDLILKSQRMFKALFPTAKYSSGSDKLEWTFKTGESLVFRIMANMDDYLKLHGSEFEFMGFNELTKLDSADVYETALTLNRTGGGNDIPLVCLSTTNPLGIGHNWVKRRFIDGAENGQLVKKETKIINPVTDESETIITTRCAIFSSFLENKNLDKQYIAKLLGISDPIKRKGWVLGSWDVSVGMAFDDLFSKDRHVIPAFKIPANWYVDRTFDWGSSHPFSVGWWACADGKTPASFVKNGIEYRFCPPKGTLIRIYEWYGAEDIHVNVGLKLSSEKIAEGIIEIEKYLIETWLEGDTIHAGAADNQIGNVIEKDTPTIAKKMEDLGVLWLPSDKSKGSRVNGFQLLRDRLSASLKRVGKGIYFTEKCEATIELLPKIPRDKRIIDDVNTNAIDHFYDDIRYRLTQPDHFEVEIDKR